MLCIVEQNACARKSGTGNCCAGKYHGRSDSLAHMNDSDGEVEECGGHGNKTKASEQQQAMATFMPAQAKAVQFQQSRIWSRQDANHNVAAKGNVTEDPRVHETVTATSGTWSKHSYTPENSVEIWSPQAAAQVIARHQAVMEQRNVQLSKSRPKLRDCDWQKLKRLPGDPKHMNAHTRLRVAILSESLLPCTIDSG